MDTIIHRIKKNLGNEPEQEKVNYLERIKELEEECMLMIRFISNLKNKNHKDIEVLEAGLLDEFSKISVNINILEKTYDSENMDNDLLVNTFGSVLKIHNRLSKLTLPATPVSIKYTEFSRGGWLEKNRTVNLLIFLTIIFFFAFLIINIFVETSNSQTGIRPYLRTLLIFCGSGLGSGFYTLITVRKYLVNRTYSPRYNPTYIIRFIIGVTAGTILALMVKPENYLDVDENIGNGIIAIVGAFSADVVAIILKRIADILKTALTGTEDNKSGQSVTEEDKQPS